MKFTTTHSDIYDAINPAKTLTGAASGKHVVVTGAGQGIGRAVAISFAQAGAKRLSLVGRTLSNLQDTQIAIFKLVGEQVTTACFSIDVSNKDEVAKMFASSQSLESEDRPPFDVLINSAGLLESPVNLAYSDPTVWWEIWQVNVLGTYLFTKHFLAQAPDSAVVIMTSSIGCDYVTPGWSAYQSGKLAINRLAEFVDKEYSSKGMRCFAFHPGSIWTGLSQSKVPESLESTFVDTVELAGGFCVWLASEMRADFLSGRYIAANWDVDELLAKREEIVGMNLFKTRVIGLELG